MKLPTFISIQDEVVKSNRLVATLQGMINQKMNPEGRKLIIKRLEILFA